MPYRCYALGSGIMFNASSLPGAHIHPPGFSPPGTLRDANSQPLPGWCRISPTYSDLPADASPAIRSMAQAVFGRLCYLHQVEIHNVEGGRYAFRIECLYDGNPSVDRWYFGIGVYQRNDPQSADPGTSFALPGYTVDDKDWNTPYPIGTKETDLGAIARSRKKSCTPGAGDGAHGGELAQKSSGTPAAPGEPSSYPSWVIGLGLAAVGASVYFLTRQKPSTFKSNSAKRNGFKVRTGDLV